MRFYVYRLVDPRDGQPFYIGKGSRRRIEHHEIEARGGGASPKCARIREIWNAGQQVVREIVQRFQSEAEAYRYEAELIEAIGLSALTNLVPGGGGANGRSSWSQSYNRPAQPWTLAMLTRIRGSLVRALFEYSKHRQLHVAGTDITAHFQGFVAMLMNDVGYAAFIQCLGLDRIPAVAKTVTGP